MIESLKVKTKIQIMCIRISNLIFSQTFSYIYKINLNHVENVLDLTNLHESRMKTIHS